MKRWQAFCVDYYLAAVEQVPADEVPSDEQLAELGGILAAYEAIAQFDRDAWREINDDQDETIDAKTMIGNAHDTDWKQLTTIIALSDEVPRPNRRSSLGLPLVDRDTKLDPSQVLGRAMPQLNRLENTDRIELWGLYVRPQFRRQGIGSALLRATEDWAQLNGRSMIVAGSDQHLGQGADALRPKEGELAIAPDAATAFALSHGYQLAQAERHSVQDITAANLELASRHAVAHTDYQLHTFVGNTPQQLRAAMIQLHIDMSTDIPTGEIETEAEKWDEARLQNFEANVNRNGESLITMAIQKASGQAAGYTHLTRPFNNPAVVYQMDTVVNRAHRGHGLGLALKAATLLAATKKWPETQRIHTWNASENDHMWRVNEKLGYRTASLEAIWQKRL